MRSNSFKIFVSILVLFITILACAPFGGGSSGNAQPAPTLQSAQLPSGQATDTPAPASSGGGKYFQEDFKGNLNNWSQFVVNGSKYPDTPPLLVKDTFGKMSVGVKDDYLVFDLESKGQWAYALYDPQEYDDVRIDVSVENRTEASNDISLICRYSPDQGWYEFSIEKTGKYALFYGQVETDGTTLIYSKLLDGAYSKFKTGKDTNELGLSCSGRTLTLFINGNQVKQYDDNQYVLKKGKIGVSAASANDTPVIVGFDWVKVSQP